MRGSTSSLIVEVLALIVLYARELGLTYEPSDKELYGMSDSDWATRHSTTGWVFIMNQAALSWGSKKQPSVALSSCEHGCEAEIMAASEAAKEAVYLARLAWSSRSARRQ